MNGSEEYPRLTQQMTSRSPCPMSSATKGMSSSTESSLLVLLPYQYHGYLKYHGYHIPQASARHQPGTGRSPSSTPDSSLAALLPFFFILQSGPITILGIIEYVSSFQAHSDTFRFTFPQSVDRSDAQSGKVSAI